MFIYIYFLLVCFFHSIYLLSLHSFEMLHFEIKYFILKYWVNVVKQCVINISQKYKIYFAGKKINFHFVIIFIQLNAMYFLSLF